MAAANAGCIEYTGDSVHRHRGSQQAIAGWCAVEFCRPGRQKPTWQLSRRQPCCIQLPRAEASRGGSWMAPSATKSGRPISCNTWMRARVFAVRVHSSRGKRVGRQHPGACAQAALTAPGVGGRHGGFEWRQPQPRLKDRQVARDGPAALPSHEKALTYNNLIDRLAYYPMVNADAYSISIFSKPRRPAMR
jgi:hypothetical protein